MENFLRGANPTEEQDSSQEKVSPIKFRVQREVPAARASSILAGD